LKIVKDFEATVEPIDQKPQLKFGDEIIGVVTDINEPIIVVQVEYNPERWKVNSI